MKHLRWSICWASVALAITAATSACADGPGSPGATPAATAPATVGSPTATGSPVPVPADAVTVMPSALTYAVGEVVRVTVHNGRQRAIYTEDFQTECTIVTLQKSDAGSWTDMTGCGMGRPTRTVTLETGREVAVQLDPRGFHLAEGPGELGFGAGTYRIKFGYRLEPEPMGTQPLVEYSPTFVVR